MIPFPYLSATMACFAAPSFQNGRTSGGSCDVRRERAVITVVRVQVFKRGFVSWCSCFLSCSSILHFHVHWHIFTWFGTGKSNRVPSTFIAISRHSWLGYTPYEFRPPVCELACAVRPISAVSSSRVSRLEDTKRDSGNPGNSPRLSHSPYGFCCKSVINRWNSGSERINRDAAANR